jgi:predicted flavoprotein YhiN
MKLIFFPLPGKNKVFENDGDTGGYNLQEAFSTGYLAGESTAK